MYTIGAAISHSPSALSLHPETATAARAERRDASPATDEDGEPGKPYRHPVRPADRDELGPADSQLRQANERTFLAWIRTSLALTATGLAVTELLPHFHTGGGRRAVGLPLIALGMCTAALSYREWRTNERAVVNREVVPLSHLPIFVAVGVAVVAALALVLVALP
jgi:putative membrane protein